MIKLLISINLATNRRRYYRIAVEPTLLGSVCVTRIYGRLGGKERRMAPIECKNEDQALRLAQRLILKRIKRGYHEHPQKENMA